GVDVYRAVFLAVAIERRKEVGRNASSQITCSAPTHTSAFVLPEKRQIYSGGSRLARQMTANLDEGEQRVKRAEREIQPI
ncbi:Hypothetical predicted protein, partial [Olea europaea subsp. europaea]